MGVMLATAIASPSSATVSVYIGTLPPRLVHEESGPLQNAGFVWMEGYWAPVGHRYEWVRGRGNIRRFKGHTGRIRITTTIAKVGNCMRGIGTTRPTTTAIGAIMTAGGRMVVTTTVGMSTTTNR
jgi:hypothetical protein